MSSISPSIQSSIQPSISDSFGNALSPIDAIVHFNETSIVGSSPVTAWNNIGTGGSAFDLDVVLGTGANITRIQSNNLDVVNSSSSAGLETTAGQTINTPMTIFMVGKANALTAANQTFAAARDLATSSPKLLVNVNDDFVFNAGAGLVVGTVADTELHLHTVRHNGDSTTSYEVSGEGKTIGDAGAENMQFGTFFADNAGAGTINGFIAEYIIYPRQLADFEVNNVQSFLTNKWNL